MVRAWLAALAVLVALPASAQQLVLDIKDGLVTMQATNVPVRQVLAEWGRVGGTRIVGAERLAGPPLTLQFEGVPEAKALDIVLRSAAGYVAAPRSASSASAGRSAYDRILVLASSTPPAGGAGPVPAAAGRGPNRFPAPPTFDTADNDAIAADEPTVAEPPQVNPFANAFGQAGAQPFAQPAGPNPFAQPNPFQPSGAAPFGAPPNPFGQVYPTAPVGPTGVPSLFGPATAPGAPAPTPFGAAMPGVVQQPQVDAQGRPRPPGPGQ
ncbi:MAG: hypothetical protein AB7O28_25920 [Vicinamibacterales bacterium]